jgi:parallel beta-helix repeat protein
VWAGTNYYVSTTGSNSNNGLTTTTAFKTITYASTIASHGDTIQVLNGTYTNTSYGTWNIWKVQQTVKINNKNSASGNYLVIKPYQNAAVKIKGDGDYIFQIRNSSYIQVEGFEIEGEVNNIPLDSAIKYQFVYHDNVLNKDTFRVAFGTPAAVVATMTFPVLANIINPTTINNIGLLVQNSNHVNIIENIIHHNTGTGLRVFQSDYINVIGNDIHNNSRRSSVGNHGLVFHSSTSIDNNDGYKIFISRNTVHDNYNEVYSWSSLKTFITPYIDEGKGISMQKNTLANGWVHGKIKIENNIAHHNGFSGIHINQGVRMDIINNTAYNNSFSFDGNGNNLGISVQDGDSIGIYNNISVANTSGFAISAGTSTNLMVANNLVTGVIDSDIDAIDVATIFANPLFVDTLQFKLQASSQAINNGLFSAAPTTDYYSVVRDATPDIGAAEYNTLVLPISLLNFYLSKFEINKVKLFWQTAYEINNKDFTVQKSRDAFTSTE